MNENFYYVHNLEDKSEFRHIYLRLREAGNPPYFQEADDCNALGHVILKEAGAEVLDYIGSFTDLRTHYNSTILTTETGSYVDQVDFNNVRNIFNFRKINDTSHPDNIFRSVNKLLPDGGIYICRVETYHDRNLNFIEKYGRVPGYIARMLDIVINRAIPRTNIAGNIYRLITKERLLSLSCSEILGRLAYCGFEIAGYKTFRDDASGQVTYFIARKIKEPYNGSPSFYPLIKLRRVGKDGRMQDIYKLRTMYPYSEYLQDYMIRVNGHDRTGRPARDFRVTRWGRVLRKCFLDELPQLLNVLKGEMKLVGVRPLSEGRFNELPADVRSERIKYKPGCIPPYVALNMPGDMERIEAERIYLGEYKNNPFLTDLKYLLRAVKNMLFLRMA